MANIIHIYFQRIILVGRNKEIFNVGNKDYVLLVFRWILEMYFQNVLAHYGRQGNVTYGIDCNN